MLTYDLKKAPGQPLYESLYRQRLCPVPLFRVEPTSPGRSCPCPGGWSC